MGIPVTDYTDSDAVRAAAGVSTIEWADTRISDLKLDDYLLDELDEWLDTHAAIYSAGTGSTPTAPEARKLRLLRLYAQWFCAAKLVGLWMAWPAEVEDGKNRMQRFVGLDLELLSKRTAANASKFRSRLLALELGQPGTGTWKQFGRVEPAYDPVAGD